MIMKELFAEKNEDEYLPKELLHATCQFCRIFKPRFNLHFAHMSGVRHNAVDFDCCLHDHFQESLRTLD